jgi:flagellar assembly protein FliH
MISSSELVPKAELSAYQRWELASLIEAADAVTEADRAAGWNTAGEREAAAVQEQTKKEGYAAGYAAGIGQAEDERTRLAALLVSMTDNAGGHLQQLLDEVLDFSILLARQMVGEALAVRPELVLPVVSAALKQLPQMSQSVQLLLNPADLELVRAFLAAEPTPVGCALLADATIAPGGCRIVTEQCEVDATVQTRWRRLLANLGCSDEWLAPV